MNLDERSLGERLQAEAARIPLPPRDRWVPGPRRTPRLMPAVATLAVLAFVVLVGAPVLEQLRGRDQAASSPQVVVVSPTCGPRQDQTTPATCLLIPGTLVEIVGSTNRLEASTPLVRVRLESPLMSAQFGNPALFEADAHTQIDPSSSTIAATGVQVGARVEVAFDSRAPKTASGAYLLTRFVVVTDGALPDCLLLLDIASPPRPGSVPSTGAASAEDAFRRTFPEVAEFKMFPFGTSADSRMPVWIVAATGETYIAQTVGAADAKNSWFAYPAKFVRCRSPQEVRFGQPTPGTTPSGSPPASPGPSGTRG